MISLTLSPHPQTRTGPIERIMADASLNNSQVLAVRYLVSGKIDEIQIPSIAAPARTGGLWRRTCFEAFIAPSATGGYFEFNFSPSTQWAAYRFAAYREGMIDANDCEPPVIEVRRSGGEFELLATIDLHRLDGREPWRLGLSAVIEDADGNLSYWALAHPSGKPDFHHPDCFAHKLMKDTAG